MKWNIKKQNVTILENYISIICNYFSSILARFIAFDQIYGNSTDTDKDVKYVYINETRLDFVYWNSYVVYYFIILICL